MNSDIEVGDVSMSSFIEENIIGLQVSVRAHKTMSHDVVVRWGRRRRGYAHAPVNNLLLVEEGQR